VRSIQFSQNDNGGVLSPTKRRSESQGEEGEHPLPKVVAAVILAVGTGAILGYTLSSGGGATGSRRGSSDNKPVQEQIPESGINVGEVFGSADETTFRDDAKGRLEKNEESAVGTHRLIRDPNNPTQDAYLISSVVDLNKLVGREVQVWGETVHSEEVGWLMDVGRVKVLK